MSPSAPNSRRFLPSIAVASMFLACAKVIDLEAVPFSASGEADATDDAGGDSGVILDDTDFCHSKPDVVYCRQFDDGTDLERGAAIAITAGGRVVIDETDPSPPSSPGTLHCTATQSASNAAFGIPLSNETLTQSVKFEFSAKISAGDVVPTIAVFAYGSCRYLLSTETVERWTILKDGGASNDTHYELSPVLPRGDWFSLELSLERTADNRVALEIKIDGRQRVRVYEQPGCTLTPGATYLNLGTLWGQPFELRIDNLRIGPL